MPPYLNKWIDKLEKELLDAERKEIKARSDYEFAKEYRQLCDKKLNEAKHEEKIDD